MRGGGEPRGGGGKPRGEGEGSHREGGREPCQGGSWTGESGRQLASPGSVAGKRSGGDQEGRGWCPELSVPVAQEPC